MRFSWRRLARLREVSQKDLEEKDADLQKDLEEIKKEAMHVVVVLQTSSSPLAVSPNRDLILCNQSIQSRLQFRVFFHDASWFTEKLLDIITGR